MEKSTGDLSRKFVGGTAQQVEDGLRAKDGMCFLFLSSDWAESNLEVPNVVVSKGNEIRVIVQILDGLLMCSCVLVMSGKQCGPLHLALVAHCREYLWKITPPDVTRRIVEGSGMVDYLNIMWAIDSDFQLYRNVTESVGICNQSRCRPEPMGFLLVHLPTRRQHTRLLTHRTRPERHAQQADPHRRQNQGGHRPRSRDPSQSASPRSRQGSQVCLRQHLRQGAQKLGVGRLAVSLVLSQGLRQVGGIVVRMPRRRMSCPLAGVHPSQQVAGLGGGRVFPGNLLWAHALHCMWL